MDPKPLSDEIWGAQMLEKFKLPPLVTFDEKRDPRKHIIAINTLMEIIGIVDSLKCKLLSSTFK